MSVGNEEREVDLVKTERTFKLFGSRTKNLGNQGRSLDRYNLNGEQIVE